MKFYPPSSNDANNLYTKDDVFTTCCFIQYTLGEINGKACLSLTDEEILAKYPDKEDFLLPDINVADDPEWNNVTFAEITLSLDNEPLSLKKEAEVEEAEAK